MPGDLSEGSYKCPHGQFMCMSCDTNHASIRLTKINVPDGAPTPKPPHLDLCVVCHAKIMETLGKRSSGWT